MYVPTEWKFSSINQKNVTYYLKIIEKLKECKHKLVFVSAFVQNSGLSTSSKRNKSKEVLKLILHDCLSLVTGYMTKTSYSNVTSNLNVTLDNESDGLDVLEQENIKIEMQETINRENEYFSTLDDLKWQDSKENIMIQLADLYAGSLNNVFSEISAETETAKAKKAFATAFLDMVGINAVNQPYNYNKKTRVEFINRLIS